jgi:hypothetical protein
MGTAVLKPPDGRAPSNALFLLFYGEELNLKKLPFITFLKSHDVLVRDCNSRGCVLVRMEADYNCFTASIF